MIYTYENRENFDKSFRELAREAIALKISGPWHSLDEMHEDIEYHKLCRLVVVADRDAVKHVTKPAETGTAVSR